jgi:hypothetical protein
MDKTYVRTAGTSWASVIGGWVAAIGATALVAPLVAAILAGRAPVPNDLALAVPVVLGLMISYLIGGYVAGRMAGYHTSWHGMMTAFFGLLVALVALLVAAAADQGLLAASGVRSLSDVFPGVRAFDLRTLGDTLTFGAILGFLATIFAGWLGGLLAPSHVVAMTTVAPAPTTATETTTTVEGRPAPSRFRLLPAVGRKGGERVVERSEVHKEKVEAKVD